MNYNNKRMSCNYMWLDFAKKLWSSLGISSSWWCLSVVSIFDYSTLSKNINFKLYLCFWRHLQLCLMHRGLGNCSLQKSYSMLAILPANGRRRLWWDQEMVLPARWWYGTYWLQARRLKSWKQRKWWSVLQVCSRSHKPWASNSLLLPRVITLITTHELSSKLML